MAHRRTKDDLLVAEVEWRISGPPRDEYIAVECLVDASCNRFSAWRLKQPLVARSTATWLRLYYLSAPLAETVGYHLSKASLKKTANKRVRQYYYYRSRVRLEADYDKGDPRIFVR